MQHPSTTDNARQFGRFMRDLVAGATGHEAAEIMKAFQQGLADPENLNGGFDLAIDTIIGSQKETRPPAGSDPMLRLHLRKSQAVLVMIDPESGAQSHVWIERRQEKVQFTFQDFTNISATTDGQVLVGR